MYLGNNFFVGYGASWLGDWCPGIQDSVVATSLEDLDIDGRIILEWILKEWDAGHNWIYLAQDRDRWRALVNAVVNILAS
jgi:hypothetical protein